jgi:hypothetical protein
MEVWVYTKSELIYKNLDIEIWIEKPTQETSHFEWPNNAQKVIDRELITAIFEKLTVSWFEYKKNLVVHK